MNFPFCNVALPVPLRTTFTYAIPEPLRDAVRPGSRVLAPFRKKSLVGVVVEFAEQAPPDTKVRELSKVLDSAPALTPKLIELAHWIAGYYLAPIGEVFRAMLPPLTELRTQQSVVLTESGLAAAQTLSGGEITHALTSAEAAFFGRLKQQGKLPLAAAAKAKGDRASLERLRKLRLIEIRESVLGRQTKTQRLLAW